MASTKRERRIQVKMSAEEIVGLDEFRFQLRMPSRAALVRELLKRGLATPEALRRPKVMTPIRH